MLFRGQPQSPQGRQYVSGDSALDRLLNVPPPVRGPKLPHVIEQPRILVKEWKDDDEFLFYGNFYTTRSRLKHHTLSLGTSGSGKSLLLEISMAWALAHCKRGSGVKVIIFDPKDEFLPIAAHFAQKNHVPLYYLNISDNRAIKPQQGIAGYAWDIAQDCQGRSDYIKQALHSFLPLPEHGEPFWAKGAQSIALSAAKYLEQHNPGKWGLHDLYDCCFANIPELTALLKETSFGATIAERLVNSDATKTRDGVLLELILNMLDFQMAAAHQYYTPRERWFSIREFVKGEGIVVISQDLSARAASNPIMQAMFQMCVNVYNARAGTWDSPDTFMFLDEAPLYKKLGGITDVLTFQRSKGMSLYLTAQGIEQLMEQYGEYGAATIANNCSFKILCRTDSPTTAEWSVNLCGKKRSYEENRSYQYSAQGVSSSTSKTLVERTRFLDSDFTDIPDTNPYDGLYYFFLSPYTRGVTYKCWLSGEEIADLRPPKADIPGLIHKPARYLEMPSLKERRRQQTCTQANNAHHNQQWREEFINEHDDPGVQGVRAEILDFLDRLAEEGLDDFFNRFL